MSFFDVINKKHDKEDKTEEVVVEINEEDKSAVLEKEEVTKSFEECISTQKDKIDNLVEEQKAKVELANKKDKNHEEAVLNHQNSIDSLFEEMNLENEE